MKFALVLFLILSSLLVARGQDQKFLNFQSGRVAFEKYKDCEGAERLLTPIYSEFKDDMSYVHLYAKVLKCLDRYQDALKALKSFNALAHDQTIDEEIAELNYFLSKRNALDSKVDISGEWIFQSNDYPEFISDDKVLRSYNLVKIIKKEDGQFDIHLNGVGLLGSVKYSNSTNYSGRGNVLEEDIVINHKGVRASVVYGTKNIPREIRVEADPSFQSLTVYIFQMSKKQTYNMSSGWDIEENSFTRELNLVKK